MAAEGYLRIEGVSKRFGEFTALREVSLAIRRGEFVCFLGPSGCGKTTLLRAIAGLDIQSEGRIHQDGREISNLPPAERDFGIVFQSYALFPNLTVLKNVAYGLENRRMARAAIDTRVAELLQLVGMPEQGRKYPAQLSGGQQQRVALARALATSPGLLLLDEPLSALDAKVRTRLRHEIKELQRQLGVTTIMVTHDQEEALTMADRIVVMNHGVVEQIGTPEEIYSDPASAFVADFIGTMNFLPAVVSGPGRVRLGDVELESDDGEGLSSGTPVTLAVRPEDIIAPAEAAPAEEKIGGNVVEGTLGAFEFLGYYVRADLVLPGVEAELRCDLSHNRIRRLGLHEGQRLKVAFPASRLRLYPRSAAAGGGGMTAANLGVLAEPKASAPLGGRIRPKASRDDWTMRAMMAVIGLYLLIALAFPLYAMLSKSFETYAFELSALELQENPGDGWGPVETAAERAAALGLDLVEDPRTSAGERLQMRALFPDAQAHRRGDARAPARPLDRRAVAC